MGTAYAGTGDLIRSLELLWGVREDGRRGPQPQLTVGQIAEAAITLADEEGFDGLSMRRVAERLDVGTMSLYRYVPSKAELLSLMVDRVSAETDRTFPGRGWRCRLEHVAWENRRLYERHPWLLQVFPARVMGPGLFERYDHELRSIDRIGLSDVEMDLVLTLVHSYVRGAMLDMLEASRLRERTGLDDVEWWNTISPTLIKIVDPARYPVASRLGAAASAYYLSAAGGTAEMTATQYEIGFEFGLERLLDGIGALVRKKRKPKAKSKARR